MKKTERKALLNRNLRHRNQRFHRDQTPPWVKFRATAGRFGLHLGKQSSDFIDRNAFSSYHILLVLLRGCDFGCNV